MSDRIRVLFVCTGNSSRSIFAEAVLRHVAGDRFEAASAGTHPSAVHPLAERALADAGIDRSGLRSKSVDQLAEQSFDYVSRCVTTPGRSARSSPAPTSHSTGDTGIRRRPLEPTPNGRPPSSGS